jgi:hypothetical protein
MRLPGPHVRRLLAVSATAFVVLGGGVSAFAANVAGATHPHRVAPPGAVAARGATRDAPDMQPQEFATTANPISLDPPVQVPPTQPVAVTIDDDAAFGNAPPPATTTVTLPAGRWAEVVLDVTGTEQGRQYDRLLNVFDGPVQIFLGVTPEPTAAGITWHVQKDITAYLPLLTGTRTFSTSIDNYLSSLDNGIPVITAKLLFYPAGGRFRPARVASLADPALAGDAYNESGPVSTPQRAGVPTDVIPILPSGDSTDFNTVNTGQTLTATVTLPDNVTTATLDLYAVGQIDDEFWWSEVPAFREIEVSIDGKPAGVVWPFPYVYTGGVNPLIWRPLTGIHTLDIPAYRLDLTPFAGLLGGTHTISLTVTNNAGYWLAGGDLMLTAGGAPTTGSLTSDTLSFPTTSSITTSDALGSSNQPVSSESANASYQISGTITQGRRSWTDTLAQSAQFGNDQTNFNPSCNGPCYQWVHQEVTSSGSETISGPGVSVTRSDTSSYTIDAPNAYLTNASGSDFFLPASVSQQLTDIASQSGGPQRGYQTSLSESITGYGALEEDNSATTIADGDTTGTITVQDSWAPPYLRTVVTRGGSIVEDVTS